MCDKSVTSKRVAVIGAGPSGLAVLRAFEAARKKGEAVPEIVCYERQEDLGGLWNYTWRTGTDEFGEPVHTSMYRYLWSNGPKEGLEFADYTFEEHFGRPIGSYPPREVLWDYIKGRIDKSNVRHMIKFRHPVRFISWDESTKKFTVRVHDLLGNREFAEEFDFVVAATGHFSTPNVPSFPGFTHFNGRILHAHDFRDALEFKDKRVLLIGRSYSAEDIGSQCYKYGAKHIIASYRSKPMGFKWPKNFEERPLLQRVDGNTAYFKDGSSAEVDAIILCTGYLHHHPYIQDELRLKTDNRLWPLGLYRGVISEENHNLFWIGMQDQYYTFNMFDVQAWFARDVMLGKITLPSKEEMKAHSAQWRAREESLQTAEDEIHFQGDYVKELLALSDYPKFDVDAVNEVFIEWGRHKAEDIMTFRDKVYRSVMTGKVAPYHHTKWLDALDDSLESYLTVPSHYPSPSPSPSPMGKN